MWDMDENSAEKEGSPALEAREQLLGWFYFCINSLWRMKQSPFDNLL